VHLNILKHKAITTKAAPVSVVEDTKQVLEEGFGNVIFDGVLAGMKQKENVNVAGESTSRSSGIDSQKEPPLTLKEKTHTKDS